MPEAIIQGAVEIWNHIAKDPALKNYKVELEIHKKMLAFFQVGEFYYYLFNLQKHEFDYVSPEITNVLGYDVKEYNLERLLANIHPHDQPAFLQIEQAITNFFSIDIPERIPNYKIRYDYRVKKKDGNYARILQQMVVFDSDEQGAPLRTFGVHTDISFLKQNGAPVLSFIGLNGRPSHVNVKYSDTVPKTAATFSRRELEVLHWLTEGKKTQEISHLLHLSPLTVQTHRRNILKKTGCTNTATLIKYVIENGVF
jgi:DNA-binding CsgD family transcriptional regulator